MLPGLGDMYGGVGIAGTVRKGVFSAPGLGLLFGTGLLSGGLSAGILSAGPGVKDGPRGSVSPSLNVPLSPELEGDASESYKIIFVVSAVTGVAGTPSRRRAFLSTLLSPVSPVVPDCLSMLSAATAGRPAADSMPFVMVKLL